MQIKTLTGHLTQTEKSHIKAILKAGLTESIINNRKLYFLDPLENNIYKCEVKEWQKNDYGKKVLRNYKSKFELKN